MFKLKYKFKKILRFINKILRVILIFGCIASLLTFNASAAVYRNDDNFFEVFANSTGIVYSDERGEEYYCERAKHSYTYSYIIPTAVRGLEWASFSVGEEILQRVSSGNLVLLKGTIMIRDDLGTAGGSPDNLVDYIIGQECPLSVIFSSSTKAVLIETNSRPLEYKWSADNRWYARYEFDISFTIPEDFDYYDDVRLFFMLDLRNSGGGYDSTINRFYLGSDSLSLYIGDENNAPIYSGYDNSINDELGSTEDRLMDESQAGFDEFDSLRGDTTAILQNGSFLNGALFVTNIYNHLTRSLPWFNSLLKISLTLGLFVALLTSAVTIGKRVK